MPSSTVSARPAVFGNNKPSTANTASATTAAATLAHLNTVKTVVMESFGQARSQMSQQASHAQQQMKHYGNWLNDSLTRAADTLRDYVNRYPPLAAFLFTLVVLCAVPVGVFALFAVITSSIFLSIALIGFGVVEGFFLMVGGGILLAVLSCIGLVTTIGFSWIGAIYVVYKGGSSVFSRLGQQAQYGLQRTQESLQHMTSAPTSSSSQQQQPLSSQFANIMSGGSNQPQSSSTSPQSTPFSSTSR